MYCNGLPERNIGFIPYVQEILRILDSESLAIEPIQLNLKLDGGREMCERCMKTREEQAAWDKTHPREVGVGKGEELKQLIKEGEMKTNECNTEDQHGTPYCHTHKCGPTDPCMVDGCPHCIGEQAVIRAGGGYDKPEVPREVQSRSLLHHKIGKCPQCEGDMYVVSTKKAFGKPNQACECEDCGLVENR